MHELPTSRLAPTICPLRSFMKHWMRGLTYYLFHGSAAKINDRGLNAPQGNLWMIISFQFTALCDVFHIDLSAPLKQTREWIVMQFTRSWGRGAGSRALMCRLSYRLDSLVDWDIECRGQRGGRWLNWKIKTPVKQRERKKGQFDHRALLNETFSTHF